MSSIMFARRCHKNNESNLFLSILIFFVSVCLSAWLSLCLSVSLPSCLFVCLSAYLSVSLSVSLSNCLSPTISLLAFSPILSISTSHLLSL